MDDGVRKTERQRQSRRRKKIKSEKWKQQKNKDQIIFYSTFESVGLNVIHVMPLSP